MHIEADLDPIHSDRLSELSAKLNRPLADVLSAAIDSLYQREAANEENIIFASIENGGRTLFFTPPLRLKPYHEEGSDGLLIVTDEDLQLRVYAQTREQLAEDLAVELFFLWDEYAHEPDETLTDKAQELKRNLLARCREVSYAA
jgi:hypothetical protein